MSIEFVNINMQHIGENVQTSNQHDSIVRKLKSEIQKANKCIEKEKNINRRLQSQLKSKSKQFNYLMKINILLQEKVIGFFEHEDTLTAAVTVRDQVQNAFPSVGFIRKADNMIHLGEGEWLSHDTYKRIVFNSNGTASKFVKKMAMAVFGPEVLIESSVFGKYSNRHKEKPARKALDPNKLCAIRAILIKFLIDMGANNVSINAERKNVAIYIAKKIWELRRPLRSVEMRKTNTIVLENSESDEDLSIENE